MEALARGAPQTRELDKDRKRGRRKLRQSLFVEAVA
jgi:hypothetical protein